MIKWKPSFRKKMIELLGLSEKYVGIRGKEISVEEPLAKF